MGRGRVSMSSETLSWDKRCTCCATEHPQMRILCLCRNWESSRREFWIPLQFHCMNGSMQLESTRDGRGGRAVKKGVEGSGRGGNPS